MSTQSKKPTVTQPRKKLPGFTTSYANDVHIDFTKLDLTMAFGQLAKSEQESEIHVWSELYSSVTMSLPQAKILAVLLALNIANIEEDAGEAIKLPSGIIAAYVPDVMDNQPITKLLEYIIAERKKKSEEAAGS